MFVAQSHFAPTMTEDETAPTAPRAARAAAADVPEIIPSRYAGGRNWPAILAVVAVHVVLIALLAKFDVIQIRAKRPEPVLIELKAMDVPPVRHEPPRPAAPPKIETAIVASPPIVVTPAPPPPIAAAPVALPPVPQPVATPAAPAAPAPITPPDASAANLGNVAPRYPVESRRQHEEGTVRLRVLISPEGSVEEVSVAKSSGHDRLDKAALEAVRHWRFRPGTQAGKPVEAVGFLSIPFALTK